MSEVRVLPVPEGSIVWLNDVVFFGDEEGAENAMDALREAIGHDRFVVLQTTGGSVVAVLGPDDLVARVREALSS